MAASACWRSEAPGNFFHSALLSLAHLRPPRSLLHFTSTPTTTSLDAHHATHIHGRLHSLTQPSTPSACGLFIALCVSNVRTLAAVRTAKRFRLDAVHAKCFSHSFHPLSRVTRPCSLFGRPSYSLLETADVHSRTRIMTTPTQNGMYDYPSSRSPGSHRHLQQTLHRQPSQRQFDAYGQLPSGMFAVEDHGTRFDTPRFNDRMNATVHSAYGGYDIAGAQAWHTAGFGQNNSLAAIGASRSLKPQNRGGPQRSGLPNVRSCLSHSIFPISFVHLSLSLSLSVSLPLSLCLFAILSADFFSHPELARSAGTPRDACTIHRAWFVGTRPGSTPAAGELLRARRR